MNWMLFSLTLLFPQAGTPSQQIPPQNRASISGFVVKMGTADPISKAAVTLSRNDGRRETSTVTTSTGGQFLFQNLEPGQYRLSVTRNGYVRTEYGARSPNRPGLPITLSPGQRLTEILLQIMPAGTITGRVFDRDGEPLANVSVQALKYSYRDGQRTLNSVQMARTNDLGEYRLFWLPPAQYFVSAIYSDGGRLAALANSIGGAGVAGAVVEALGARGGGRGSRPAPAGPPSGNAGADADEGYIPVYYPGTTEVQSAAPINLSPGLVFSGVDLTVAAVRTLRVRGQVINGVTGQPARNANVFIAPRGQRTGFGGGLESFRNRNINEQGVFEIRGVVPGSYDLVGILNERNNRMSARIPLEIGNSDVQGVTLLISPGFSLPGRLAVEGSAAGANGPDAARMRVTLRPITDTVQFGGGTNPAPVQADGTFTLQQVGHDEYRLAVAGMPRNAYIKMARLGATDVLNEGLRLDRQPTGPLEILISTNTGTADGTVVNDKQEPSANVTVVLVPDEAHRQRNDLFRTISTDALGRFHAEGVPPGDYKAFAWEDVETGAWQDPDFLRQYEDRGKPLRISEGALATIELRVLPSRL